MAGAEQGGVVTQVTFKSRDQKMHEIIPSLFVGSVFAAQDLELLNSHSITHILQVAGEFKPKHGKHFTYKVIEASDKPDFKISKHFEECIQFIDEVITVKKERILVHCLAGQSRSVSIVIAYLIKTHKKTFEEALLMVQQQRIYANPNKGFRLQLEEYQKSLVNVQ